MANCQPHDKSVQQNPTRTGSLVASQPFLDAQRGVAVLCHPRFNLCSSARCCGAATLSGASGNDAVYLVSVSVLVRSWGSASYSWPLSAERAGVSEPSAVFACSCQRPSGSKKKKKKEKDRESLDPQMPDTLCPRFTCRCPYSVRRASPRAEVPSAAQPLPPTGCHCPSMPACSGTRRPTVCADPARQYLLDVRVQLRALVQSSPSAPRDRHQAAHGGIVI